MPPFTPKCYECGHEAKIISDLRERDGVLGLVQGGKAKKGSKPTWTEFEKQTWFLGLKKDAMDFWAKRSHLSRDWVYKKLIVDRFRTKFSEHPNGKWNSLPLPDFVPPDVRSWITAQNIRRAKSAQTHIKARAAYHAEARHGG